MAKDNDGQKAPLPGPGSAPAAVAEEPMIQGRELPSEPPPGFREMKLEERLQVEVVANAIVAQENAVKLWRAEIDNAQARHDLAVINSQMAKAQMAAVERDLGIANAKKDIVPGKDGKFFVRIPVSDPRKLSPEEEARVAAAPPPTVKVTPGPTPTPGG